jgi:PAS domain S-box-containing protein
VHAHIWSAATATCGVRSRCRACRHTDQKHGRFLQRPLPAHLRLGRVAQADGVRRSEARFRSLVQNAPDMISVLDQNGAVIMDTPAIGRTLGYPPGARRWNVQSRPGPPDDLPAVQQRLVRIIANPRTPEKMELRARHADGRWIWCEAHARNELANPDVGGIVGAEALVRWPHPERGLVPPDVFIPIATQAGLIGRLTDWVFDAAVRQQQDWRVSGIHLPIAVNFSSRDLHDPDLTDRIERVLSRHGADPREITIELTEDSIIRENATPLQHISRLRQLGFQVSIDDFGTGYSSLARLARFPVDELKIERSFVQQVADARVQAVVRSIVDLGRNLGLRVIAEGIEDAETWHVLASLGCHQGQGYFFGRPVAAEAFPPPSDRAFHDPVPNALPRAA